MQEMLHLLQGAKDAIALVTEQGEGTAASEGEDTLAHYYAFRQFELQRVYERVNGEWQLGAALPLPTAEQVFPMAPVPAGGYPGVPEANAFSEQYGRVFTAMQRAWETPGAQGQAHLDNAINEMYALTPLGIAAMQVLKPMSSGGGNYGPDFRLRMHPLRHLASSPLPDDRRGQHLPEYVKFWKRQLKDKRSMRMATSGTAFRATSSSHCVSSDYRC